MEKNSTHYYEVDFLTSYGDKADAIEVKSSGNGKHESLSEFCSRYRNHLHNLYVFSQNDRIHFLPVYMMACMLEESISIQ